MCSCVVSFQSDYYSTGWHLWYSKLDSMHVIFSQSPFFSSKKIKHSARLFDYAQAIRSFSRCRNIQILSNIFLSFFNFFFFGVS